MFGSEIGVTQDEVPIDTIIVGRARRLTVANGKNLPVHVLESGFAGDDIRAGHTGQVV
jgi:hypothetical protein